MTFIKKLLIGLKTWLAKNKERNNFVHKTDDLFLY